MAEPNEIEVEQALSSIEDEEEFERQWAEFTLNIPYFLANEADYKQLAKVWFGKGIGRGMDWTSNKLDRMAEEQ